MIFREPMVDFVQIVSTDISTISGAGYNVCQYTGNTTVTCEVFGGDVTKSELCDQSDCATSSNATSQDDWNNSLQCDFDATP